MEWAVRPYQSMVIPLEYLDNNKNRHPQEWEWLSSLSRCHASRSEKWVPSPFYHAFAMQKASTSLLASWYSCGGQRFRVIRCCTSENLWLIGIPGISKTWWRAKIFEWQAGPPLAIRTGTRLIVATRGCSYNHQSHRSDDGQRTPYRVVSMMLKYNFQLKIANEKSFRWYTGRELLRGMDGAWHVTCHGKKG